jgi:peroxiredoxin
MTRRFGRALVAFAVAAGAAACAPATAPQAKTGDSPAAGRATDFTTRDIEGKIVRLSDYLGKQVVILDFCATWCQPCVEEIAHLEQLYEKEKSRGLVVLAISMDSPDTIAEVPAWAHRHGMTFPVLLDEDSHIASIYNPKKSAPLTVLVDRRGEIVYVHDGYNPGDEVALKEHATKALDQGAAPK